MEFVKQGKSLDSFRSHVLENLAPSPINTHNPDDALITNPVIGMNSQESRSFSIIKAIRAVVSGNWNGAELEQEASRAVAKQIGREPASFFVPLDVMRDQAVTQIRRLEKLSNVAGGYIVGTDYQANNFIELLRNKMLVKQMGARVMSGLTGDVAIPKQTGGATTYWVSEGGAPNHSQQSFGQITLSPKSIAAFTDFTRKLVLQSSPDIEALVRDDLACVIALELDRVAIAGTGNGAEPVGIINTRGVESIAINVNDPNDQDALDWGKIVDLESSIAAKNADIGTLGYLCNANMRGLLKQKEKAESTAQFIWENGNESGFGMLNGYRVGTTNQMPANTIIFGNFADLIIGQWGVMDVLVDPYTLGTSGGIRIRIMQDVDLAIRHAESFAVAKV
jgi:HK97 family phage major capsid protein